MNEENNNVENQESQNYSYQFNPDANIHNDGVDSTDSVEKENNQQESYLGGYQLNTGKALVKTLGGKSSSMMRNPYGFRGPWNSSGKVSVMAMVIILVIMVLFVLALFIFR